MVEARKKKQSIRLWEESEGSDFDSEEEKLRVKTHKAQYRAREEE